MELWKDDEYVELAESTIRKIRTAVNKGEVLPKYGSRAIRLLETQDDYSFVNDMVKHAENGTNLTNAIYRRGEKLIKELKPIPFAEGHHEASVGTHGRLKNYSFRKTLQINAINASRGSYVGTSFKNLSFLSRYVHSGDEAIAHINPWASVHLLKDGSFDRFLGKTTDTGIWATREKPFLNRELPSGWEETFGTTNKKHARLLLRAQKEFVGGQKRYTALNRNLDPFTAARRLTDESLDPQRMLTRAAFNDPTEVAVRKALKDILGTDVFSIKDPKKIQEIYKITSAAGINMNEMYELAKEGKLDNIDFKKTNPGNIKNLILEARKGAKFKPPDLSGLSKQFTKANILNKLSGAVDFADKATAFIPKPIKKRVLPAISLVTDAAQVVAAQQEDVNPYIKGAQQLDRIGGATGITALVPGPQQGLLSGTSMLTYMAASRARHLGENYKSDVDKFTEDLFPSTTPGFSGVGHTELKQGKKSVLEDIKTKYNNWIYGIN